MLNLHAPHPHASHVIALYQDGWDFFDLPAGASLVELAGRLDNLSEAHHGAAIEVNVRFETSLRPPKTEVSSPRSAMT
jgi:hypothetical protein